MIKINSRSLIPVQSHARADFTLSHLLHECVHAYLDLNSCRGSCDDADYRARYEEQIGGEGRHGERWAKLARFLEALLRRFVSSAVEFDIEYCQETAALLDEG